MEEECLNECRPDRRFIFEIIVSRSSSNGELAGIVPEVKDPIDSETDKS